MRPSGPAAPERGSGRVVRVELEDVWPLFRLRLRTPRLELRVARDEDFGGLVDAALAGIHDPDVMPFLTPWSDAEPADLARGQARYAWRLRADAGPDDWTLYFAVLHDGVPIGVQDVRANRFPVRRTIETVTPGQGSSSAAVAAT